MLTKVTLDGPMGKEFGREWNLAISSPHEALRMIDANRPGVFRWIKKNIQKYSQYKVFVEFRSGRKEEIDETEYTMTGDIETIRFVPLVEGAGSIGKIILGVVLIGLSFVPGLQFASAFLFKMGVGLVIGGVIEALSPRPSMDREQRNNPDGKASYFFNGPVNTTSQGVPVQLIYGRVLVGSHAISADVTIDQLL